MIGTKEELLMLVLRSLRPSDESTVVGAAREFSGDDFEFLPQFEQDGAFIDYLALLERQQRGQDLPATHVPSTFLVAEIGGEIVGRAYLRHRLNDRLCLEGGHVGYGVRPQFRRRGYAVEILRQSLAVLAAMGIEEALVTVDEGNVSSRRTVERCGGRLEHIGVGRQMKRMCHYWVPTSP
jgi:predicted acetyltransferase